MNGPEATAMAEMKYCKKKRSSLKQKYTFRYNTHMCMG